MFYTQYNKKETAPTKCGTGEKVTYKGKYNKSGILEVEPVGKFDLYSYIQSFRESCDINVLIKKFVNGDENALNQKVGDFIDITNMPTTFADLLNKVNAGNEMFNTLPAEIKAKFNNSASEFITSIGSEEWSNKLGINKTEVSITNQEVKETSSEA